MPKQRRCDRSRADTAARAGPKSSGRRDGSRDRPPLGQGVEPPDRRRDLRRTILPLHRDRPDQHMPRKTVAQPVQDVPDHRPAGRGHHPDHRRQIGDRLFPSRFEQPLAEEWPKAASTSNERALDVTTALDVVSNLAADQVEAEVALLDVGPSLGALNRAALLSCDAVVIPVAPDLFSLQGLRNVGPTLID